MASLSDSHDILPDAEYPNKDEEAIIAKPRICLLLATFLLSLPAMPALSQDNLRYEVDLVVDYDSGAFEGRARIQYTNSTGIALPELFFRLYANDSTLYGSAFVRVGEVSVQTASMPFSLFLNETVLMIPLNEPLQPEAQIEVELVFSGATSDWPRNDRYGSSETGYGLLTKSPSALTLTTFYPMLAVYSDEGWALDPSTGFGDTLMGDTADYFVRVTTTTGGVPVSSGILTAINPEVDSTTYAFTARNARDFSLVFLEDYVLSTTEIDGATIRTWFTSPHQQAGLLANEMAVFSFQLYEKLVGPSTFREIEFVEVPLRSAAGVEFSGLILVGTQYAEQPDDLFFSIIISHELAHQWFYAGVGNDVSEHPWLDESFATYLSYEFLDAYFDTATAQVQLDQWRNTYQTAQRDRSDLSVGSPKYAFPNSATYNSFVYSGGATFLHDLRTVLGDEVFYRGVQAYYREFLHDIATPMDLLRVFEETCACRFDDLLSEFRIVP